MVAAGWASVSLASTAERADPFLPCFDRSGIKWQLGRHALFLVFWLVQEEGGWGSVVAWGVVSSSERADSVVPCCPGADVECQRG